MPRSRFFPHLALLALLSGRGAHPAAAAAPRGADFGGTWVLLEESSDDPFRAAAPRDGTTSAGDGQAGSRQKPSLRSELDDVPLEALIDAHWIVVIDDGSTLRVTYLTGRKRVLWGDGEERQLDDGDGPARVTVKRKAPGDRVTVSSRWASGRSLSETWELSASPRRLTVTGKASGRLSTKYKRVYEPRAPVTPTPRPTVTPTPVPVEAGASPAAGAATSDASATAPAGMSTCSIRPKRGTPYADIGKLAKISSEEASKRAVASVGGQKIRSVISSDVEVNEGCLVFPIDLRLEGKNGVQEVLIDAGDGKVLVSRFEPQ